MLEKSVMILIDCDVEKPRVIYSISWLERINYRLWCVMYFFKLINIVRVLYTVVCTMNSMYLNWYARTGPTPISEWLVPS